MIKLVSFDMGGTLIKIPSKNGKSLVEKISDKSGVDQEEIRNIIWKNFVEDKNDVKILCNMYPEIEKKWLFDQISKKFNKELYEDVIELLEYLRAKGYQIITLSNDYCWNDEKMGDTGISKYFNDEIYSYNVGFSKPKEEIYSYVEKKMVVKGKEILHIGDSINSDIKGPKKMGWKTVYINRNESESENIVEADYSVRTLREIKYILENEKDLYDEE